MMGIINDVKSHGINNNGLIIDCFAGGGGASCGMEMALGRPVDIAINHDDKAINMHKINHPETTHITEDIFKVNLENYVKGQPVSLMWASPDCTHHSKAKGGKPRESGLRMLPWAIHKHASRIKPDVIVMENVEEIQKWGPLDANGYPIKKRQGEDYTAFVVAMRHLGYTWESKVLCAADFGAPTSRTRWYAILRRDEKPTVWPERTHGKVGTLEVEAGLLKPYENAANKIDWTISCPSIFESKQKLKELYGIKTVRPLATKTMERIIKGLDKYVFTCKDPFLLSGAGFKCSFLPINNGGAVGTHPKQPLSTITTGRQKLLAVAHLSKYYSGVVGQSVYEPLHTITAGVGGHFGLVLAYVTKFYKTGIGQVINEPLHTITTSAGHFGIVTCQLSDDYDHLGHWSKIRELLNRHCGYDLDDNEIMLIYIDKVPYYVSDIGLRMLTPEELKLCQGFPSNYVIDKYADGKSVTAAQQVKMIGNSVVPIMAQRIVEANCKDLLTSNSKEACSANHVSLAS